jgi:serine/threonine-protein kinase SRPK3
VYSRLGEPERLPVKRLDESEPGPGVPKYCIPPAMIFQPSEDVRDSRIIIADFGEAFFQSDERKTSHTPILLQPPEVFFDQKLCQASDIWTLGCTLYEIFGERPLFEGFMPDEDHVIAEMISTLGPLPKNWWDTWQHKSEFFNEDPSWNADSERQHAPYSRPLPERLRIMGRGEDPATCEFTPAEMESIEKLLRGMLTYDPVKRITSSATVGSEWMERWGQAKIEKYLT